MRGASFSSLLVTPGAVGVIMIPGNSQRLIVPGDRVLCVCYTFLRTAYWLIHKYFPTRSDGAIREYYRPHVFLHFPLAALGVNVRAIVYNPSNEGEN